MPNGTQGFDCFHCEHIKKEYTEHASLHCQLHNYVLPHAQFICKDFYIKDLTPPEYYQNLLDSFEPGKLYEFPGLTGGWHIVPDDNIKLIDEKKIVKLR